ncbi:MAG: hypothetical protein KGI66_02545 [Patescibacteria group bacterium]|nr:hypothetical protein [Patescibacteria group bacterium]
MTNTEQEFIDNLKSDDVKVNDDSIIPGLDKIKTGEAPSGNDSPDSDDSPRNRRERRFVKEMERVRLEAQQEREARIAAEERAKALLELNEKAEASEDPDEMKFFGDTPEGKFAKSYLDKRFKNVEEKAYQRAMDELRKSEEARIQEEAADSSEIDEGFSKIEEEFDVDLSGETAESRKLRNGFIDFVQDLTTDSFPDFTKAFEIYRQINDKSKDRAVSQRQKQLADRSMASPSQPSAPQGRQFRSGREYIEYLQSING